jgi:redox-sensitive bicupin YhaK (pirin superfamily)
VHSHILRCIRADLTAVFHQYNGLANSRFHCLRSRDSLGNDAVIGPGGIVWTQAGSGLIHEETPADTARELHAIQIFVNLSSKNKLKAPQMLRLESGDVPEWRSEAGDRVRVVVGSFGGVSSPLVPVEPFHLLDVNLHSDISFDLEDGHNALVYILEGDVIVRANGSEKKVTTEHALALHGRGQLNIETSQRAHFLILSGAQIHEPVLADGPFIMNEHSQIDAALSRFHAGAMGHLEPLSNS